MPIVNRYTNLIIDNKIQSPKDIKNKLTKHKNNFTAFLHYLKNIVASSILGIVRLFMLHDANKHGGSTSSYFRNENIYKNVEIVTDDLRRLDFDTYNKDNWYDDCEKNQRMLNTEGSQQDIQAKTFIETTEIAIYRTKNGDLYGVNRGMFFNDLTKAILLYKYNSQDPQGFSDFIALNAKIYNAVKINSENLLFSEDEKQKIINLPRDLKTHIASFLPQKDESQFACVSKDLDKDVKIARINQKELRILPTQNIQVVLKNYIGNENQVSKLEDLDLSNCSQLTNDDLAFIAANFPNLKTLNLWVCRQITDAGLAHLAGMPLTSLNLEYCDQITDAGLAHLAGMPLTSLNLNHQITDVGLAHLAGLVNLTSLNLYFCRQITRAGLAHLAGLVNLQYNWGLIR